ncbi:PIG-L family deacetylase [Corallococcus sp. CA047B]|nr:PIG-L family deacetylase [Corallococcus sp. CA047B]
MSGPTCMLVPMSPAPPPRLLLVTAHPDDETMFAGAVFQATHALGAEADLVVLTNGEGGFRYATLAESLYRLRLTDEAVGRAHLPAIRKQELLGAARILGLRDCIFLEQPDTGYSLAPDALTPEGWDVEAVRRQLREQLTRGRYDFLFLMMPTARTHAHHRLSALLALEAVAALAPSERPAVLGVSLHTRKGAPQPEGYPILAFDASASEGAAPHPLTALRNDTQSFDFDRARPSGHGGRLDFHLVVNWLIAEHKSQGFMQRRMNAADVERYACFALTSDAGAARAREFFERLAISEVGLSRNH